jgi:hypothetical protein
MKKRKNVLKCPREERKSSGHRPCALLEVASHLPALPGVGAPAAGPNTNNVYAFSSCPGGSVSFNLGGLQTLHGVVPAFTAFLGFTGVWLGLRYRQPLG